jgi:hypothetical protein
MGDELTLVSWCRLRTKSSALWLHTVLKENSSASAENIPQYVSALGISTCNELGIWAPFVVRGDLFNAIGSALRHRFAIRCRERVEVLNILIITTFQALANGRDKFALTSWIWLIITAG